MSPRQAILRFCVIFLITIVTFSPGEHQVQSATTLVFTVNSFEDLDDAWPANSICSAIYIDGGPCTLRAAITEANENIANANIIIKLPAGEYPLTIPPLWDNDNPYGDLNISDFDPSNENDITIEPLGSGPVVIISEVRDRILSVGEYATVYINNLTMRDGWVNNVGNSDQFGGGAIYNQGTLTLDGVSLFNNKVECGSLCNQDNVTGGAIWNNRNLTIKNSSLAGNKAYRGSAIFNTNGPQGGSLSISYSSISNNISLHAASIMNYATLWIFNSTFSGNSNIDTGPATCSGIDNHGTLRMQSSTMANKGDNGGIKNSNSPAGTAYVADSIFKAESVAYTNCYIDPASTWNSDGYNISSDEKCQLDGPGDLPSTDPKLGSFGNWGGTTNTFQLFSYSPAINHRPGACNFFSEITDDQRHWPRNDGMCDTGAYEFSPFKVYLPLISR